MSLLRWSPAIASAILAGGSRPVAAQIPVGAITPAFTEATDVGPPSTASNDNPDLVYAEFGERIESGRGRVEFARRGTPFDATADGAPFSLGRLRHFNHSLANPAAGPTDFDVTLGVSLAVTGVASPFDETFRLHVDNTSNNCTPEPGCADDILTFTQSGSGSRGVTIGGLRYYLKFVGFSQDGGATMLKAFRSPEDGTNSADLYAQISASPFVTPEPAPVALTFAGLAALAGVGVRRRRAAEGLA